MRKILLFIACAMMSVPQFALAQAPMRLHIAGDQKLMFDAMQKVMKRDWKGAEMIYTQVLAINGGNVDAYLQRGLMRHELGDEAGQAADGRKAVMLANSGLQANPHDANAYYQRGMGERLLKDYPAAKQDIATAVKMTGNATWQTDLQAVEFDEKAGR